MTMFGAGIPQLDPSINQPIAQPLQLPAPQPKKKGGLFGSGAANLIVAALNGYLAGRGNPVGMANLQMMNAQRQRQQEAEQEEAQYQRRRDDGFSDWVRQQSWKLAHPEAQNNDTVADYNFWKGVLPPEQFQQYIQNKVNPPRLQFIKGVGLVDVSQGGAQAPSAPVGKLTPIDEGGPTPSASGGFPRPY